MKRSAYIRQLLPALGANLAGMAAISLFLLAVGNSIGTVGVILAVWTVCFILYGELYFRARRRELEKLLQETYALKQRYLIAEVMKEPRRADDKVFYQMLRLAQRSMLEEVEEVHRQQLEYQEYVEQWVHEIKTPLTAMKLLCENQPGPSSRPMLAELEKTRRCTEQALYYARSAHTQADYTVHEVPLSAIVHATIGDNKYLLREKNVALCLDGLELTVYTDEKWVRFILGQLIANAVQYCNAQPTLSFYARREESQIRLTIQDNGLGIPEEELPRVFDKGFTGRNGRLRSGATGLGLYLCKQLCTKLGIGLTLSSGETGTRVHLLFYENHLIMQG